jgi:hypothetical protein
MVQFLKKYQWQLILIVLNVLLFLFFYWAFTPGFFSVDSAKQYSQVLGKTPLSDWHPPVFVLVWGIGVGLFNLVGTMLIIQLVMLWLSILLFCLVLYKIFKKRIISILPIFFIGLNPYIFSLSGAIWKDVHLAFGALLIVSFCLFFQTYGLSKKKIYIYIYFALILSLLLYVSALRHGYPFMLIPIIYLFIESFQTTNLKLKIYSWILCLFIISAGPLIITKLSSPESQNVAGTVMTDDIVDILSSEEITKTVEDKELANYLVDLDADCAEKTEIKSGLFLYCGKGQNDYLLNVTDDNMNTVRSVWLKTILNNPDDYAVRRIRLFVDILVPEKIYNAWPERFFAVEETHSLVYPARPSTDLLKGLYFHAYNDMRIGFKLYSWILLSLIGILVVYKRRKENFIYNISLILYLSGLLYVVPLIITMPVVSYRYTFWTTVAASAATSLLIGLKVYSFYPKPKKRNKIKS